MKLYTAAFVAFLSVAVCSTVTESNYAKIQNGMSEQQVVSLLGNPSETSSINVLGLSGTSSKWISKDAVITVQFFNGKARMKSFERQSGQ